MMEGGGAMGDNINSAEEELSHAFGAMNINKENNGAFGQQKQKMM